MFVDFGFAEKYELGSKNAFMSNLAYGTPEVGHVSQPPFDKIGSQSDV